MAARRRHGKLVDTSTVLTTKLSKAAFRNPRCREVAGIAFYSDVWRQVRRLLEPIKLQQTPHIGPFAIEFHFYEQKAVEVREETPGDHSFLMLWTISDGYSPANNLSFSKSRKNAHYQTNNENCVRNV